MKYEKFDILKKAKYSIIPNNRELYIVYVECDANDGDYMRDTLEFDNEFNEAQAQVYANFMCEFIETTEEPF